MALNIGTLIVVVAILGIITPYLSQISYEATGNSNYTENLTALSYSTTNGFNEKIIYPLVGWPSNGVSNKTGALIVGTAYSQNMTSWGGIFGYAFIFPNLILVLFHLLMIPQIIGGYIASLVSFLPMAPFETTSLSYLLTGLGWLLLGLIFLSSWLKYPILGG